MSFNSYFVSHLRLNAFRNYSSTSFDFGNQSHIIHGDNGVGKTNILEAISLLSAGKGIRSANLDELVKNSEDKAGVLGTIYSKLGVNELAFSVEFSEDSDAFKKKYFLDGNILRNKTLLNYYLNCIWLIPQMDNFFLQDNASKRKFIDRLIFNLDKSHLSRLNEHDKLVRERNKILSSERYNAKWLDLLEEKLVEISVPLVISRIDFLNNLNAIMVKDKYYPLGLSFSGVIEDLVQEYKYSLKVENIVKERMSENRRNDLFTGGTSIGAHKSKLLCNFLAKNSLAENASTGEQKMMLIGIIASFMTIIQKVKNITPILLLDEINVHLDKQNTEKVIERLLSFQSQTFITTTNIKIFDNFSSSFEFLKLK